MNAEIAKLRDGSDLREAVAKAKKAEKDPLLLGCSKCRGSKKGCGQCRNPEFNGSRWQKK